jgi:hypothetical protein
LHYKGLSQQCILLISAGTMGFDGEKDRIFLTARVVFPAVAKKLTIQLQGTRQP